MKSLLLWNLKFIRPNEYKEFDCDVYHFEPVYVPKDERNPFRKQVITYKVTFNGKQKDTIMWRGGVVLPLSMKGVKLPQSDLQKYGRKRKIIEDILIMISVLTGCNVALNSQKDSPNFPLRAKKIPCPLCITSASLEKYLNTVFSKFLDHKWQKKYQDGFYLTHFNNAANITTKEPRFLSYLVLWELLYSLENNRKESMDLNKIITFLMDRFFGFRREFKKEDPCIFYLIRNQLAHNGILPLSGNRIKNAKREFRDLSIDDCYEYLDFFGQLTYTMVLITTGIDLDPIKTRLGIAGFEANLNAFINNDGLVPAFHQFTGEG